MKIRPLYDRIVVKRIEEQETVRGGIIIPDSAKEKPQQALVKAVGNGKLLENGKRAAPDVKAGELEASACSYFQGSRPRRKTKAFRPPFMYAVASAALRVAVSRQNKMSPFCF